MQLERSFFQYFFAIFDYILKLVEHAEGAEGTSKNIEKTEKSAVL